MPIEIGDIQKSPLKVRNGVYYDGNFIHLEYEELCDLFAHYRDTGGSHINQNMTPEMAGQVFGPLLPMTDY